jgi:hypothetical protein
MSDYSIQQRRPAAVLVLAVLHLVGGSLGLLAGLCGLAGQAMQGVFAGPGGAAGNPGIVLQKKLEALPGQQAFTLGELGANLVLDVMLITAGIGLLNLRPWARTLSLVYAPLAILKRLAVLAYTFMVIIPRFDAIVREWLAEVNRQGAGPGPGLPVEGFADTMRITMTVSAIVSALFIAYPVVVLVLLNLPSVKAAFKGQAPPPPADLPEDDGWAAMKPRTASTDVTRPPLDDPDRQGFRPPEI